MVLAHHTSPWLTRPTLPLSLRPQRAAKERYRGMMGKFGKAQVQDVLSAAFVSAKTLVTGSSTGELLMWDVDGARSHLGQAGSCIKVRYTPSL